MSGDERYLSPVLFTTDFSTATTSESYIFKTAQELHFKEKWFQDAIANNPDLVLSACRASGLTDEQWKFWAREVPAGDAGSIDLLLISESGRIGIVETKLAYNPGARREVVAQVLEYAINLSSISQLPDIPKVDGRPFADEEDVRDSLQKGDYLLIVAGDKLDSRAVKLSEALLGKHLLRAWALALVEVAVFESYQTNPEERTHLLVPHVRGTIAPVRRQVVTIDIKGDRTRIDVTPATPAAIANGWDEERFFKEAHVEGSLPLRRFAEVLRHLRDEYPNVTLAFGRGATPTVTLRKEGKSIVSLYLVGPVSLTFSKPSFSPALGKPWGEYYQKKLEALFPEEMKKKDWVSVKLRPSAAQEDLDELSAILKDVLTKSALDEGQLASMTMV